MAETPALPPANEPPQLALPDPLSRGLTRFAQVLRRTQLTRAIGWAVALLLGGFTLAALADRWLLLEDFSRRVLALLLYAAACGLGWWLIRRALRKRSAAEIALDLESRVPREALEERVSTTVELAARQAGSEGYSPALVERVADEAAERLQKLDLESLPDRKPMRRALQAGGACLAVMILLALAPGWHMPLQYARAFLPWLNLPRASTVQVEVLPGESRVVEGQALDVEAEIGGAPVEEAWLETRTAGGSWQRLRMDRDPLYDERFRFKLGPLHTPLEYRVSAGDGRSVAFGVQVLPRPEIAGLAITVHDPKYTGREPRTYERTTGDLEVLAGSRIELALQSTTPLEAAVLEFANDRRLSLSVEETRAAGGFEIAEDTSYRVRLRSTEGVVNPDAPLFTVRARPDQTPQVAVLKPQADQNADALAVLPLEARAEDDLGIASMRLVIRAEHDAKPIVYQLARPADGGKVWMVSQPWDLAGLFLGDGETLTYRVEAVDAKGSVGKSDERRLKIDAAGRRVERRLLERLDEAQRRMTEARKHLAAAARDVAEMRQVFRVEDPLFQAAERLLLAEAFVRVGREAQGAATAIREGREHAEPGALAHLLEALQGELERYADTNLQPLRGGAARAQSGEGRQVAAGLDVLHALLPGAQETLGALHEGLSAAHRYAGATQVEHQATEIREASARVGPVLVGSAGWSDYGPFVPGLLAEYFRGINFDALVRRTVEVQIDYTDPDLPDLGREVYSIRWTGQALAPKAGKYVYAVSADDGVRLWINGKPVIDKWLDQAPTAYEAEVDLAEGWHEVKLEFYQNRGGAAIRLQRREPGETALKALPGDWLRSGGTGAAANKHAPVAQAMAGGASQEAVAAATARLQTVVDVSRELPRKLEALARLKPKPDTEVEQWSKTWTQTVQTQTAPLHRLTRLTPALAVPLLEWNAHAANWVNPYAQVRQRWKQAMDAWSQRMAAQVYSTAAKLRRLQEGAKAVREAYTELVQQAAQPESPKRAEAMARADATARALAEDLDRQAAQLAAQLRDASADPKQDLDARRALQALAQRAETLARGPAAELERRINEAPDPQALAETAKQSPNPGVHAQHLEQGAAELAGLSERVERALALRDSLKDAAGDAQAAKAALDKPAAPETAIEQKRAAAEFRDAAQKVQAAVQAAQNQIQPQAIQPAAQVAHHMLHQPAPGLLDEKAAEAQGAPPPDAAQADARKKARTQAAGQLEQLAQQAEVAAEAVNQDLGRLADALNGDAAQNLRQAANDAQHSGQHAAVAQQADPKQPQAAQPHLDAAAANAENARNQAARTAENLALDAEGQREAAQNDAQRQAADDLARLGAALRQEAANELEPAAQALAQARRDPSQASQLPKDFPAQATDNAKTLNEMAEIAAALRSQNPQAQAAAHEKLDALLGQQGQQAQVNDAVAQAAELNQLAGELAGEKNAAAPGAEAQPEGEKNAQAGADLAAARKELAEKLGQTGKHEQLGQQALAAELGDLAAALREQAEGERQAAGHMDQAGEMEAQARGALKAAAPELQKQLNQAGAEAGQLAPKAAGQPLGAPLEQAKQAFPQAAQAAGEMAAKADSAPLGELAAQLDAQAQGLQKPVGALAAALGDPVEGVNEQARALGQQAREAAGREADLAGELRRAERAQRMGEQAIAAQHGTREELEAQVRAALGAMQEQNLVPNGQEEALARLREAANAPDAGEAAQARAQAAQARAAAARMDGMAHDLDKLSQAMRGNAPGLPEAGDGQQASRTPAADALQALAQAEAAQKLGQAGEAQAQQARAAELLAQAAQASRAQATGLRAAGRAEAQQLAMHRAKAQGQPAQAQGQAQGEAQGQEPGEQEGQAGKGNSSQPGKGSSTQSSPGSQGEPSGPPPPLPPGLPIDQATWNQLPDSLRRDLLNAGNARFPAEYEASIRRYFKRVAAARESER